MTKAYKISAENAAEIKEVRKTITDKKVDRRLYAVQLRGEGLTNDEIAQKLDTSDKMVSQWVSAYIKNGGITALLPKERIGMHRNLSIEEEKEFLSAYTKQAEAGQIIDLNELKAAYIEKVGHSIGGSQIYRMLERHGW
jgi:transposase